MKTNIAYEASRRAFLQACTIGLGTAGLNGAFPARRQFLYACAACPFHSAH